MVLTTRVRRKGAAVAIITRAAAPLNRRSQHRQLKSCLSSSEVNEHQCVEGDEQEINLTLLLSTCFLDRLPLFSYQLEPTGKFSIDPRMRDSAGAFVYMPGSGNRKSEIDPQDVRQEWVDIRHFPHSVSWCLWCLFRSEFEPKRIKQ